METNPFTLLARSVVATFEISMHIAIFVIQTIIFLCSGRRDKVGDAIGNLGKGTTDAIVRMFHK